MQGRFHVLATICLDDVNAAKLLPTYQDET